MKKTRWHQELEILAQIKNALIFEGNIFDIYPYPIDDENTEWYDLPAFLHKFFKDQGYHNVIQYNHIDGFYSAEVESDRANEAMTAFSSLMKVPLIDGHIKASFAGRGDAPNEAPNLIKRAVMQEDESVVFILNMASRYICSPDQITPEEHKGYSIIQQAIFNTKYAETFPNTMRKNMVVFIANKKNDLPAWLFLNVSEVKGINLDYPSFEDRKEYIGGDTAKLLFHPDVYNEDILKYKNRKNELKRLINRFVGRTEGFTFSELNELTDLCVMRKTRIPDACSIIDLYSYGISANPWLSPDLSERLHNGITYITSRVKGQNDAVTRSLDILKRAVSGLSQMKNESCPKGVLFFAGPTGTGKTETAKALAELVFGDENACIRFDMSEYRQENSDQRLLGAPPGYVGYEAGGQLTNAVLKKPFSILLFDEIDKASPSIMDKFLQILEDGRMTDGQGNTVFFSECVIIFTSNLGIIVEDQYGNKHANVTKDMSHEEVREKVRSAIEDHFKFKLGRPEILNRIGENIVVFDYINEQVADEILRSKLTKTMAFIQESKGIELSFKDEVRKQLLQEIVKKLDNGGREVNNIIETYLTNPIARHIFDEKIGKGEKRTITKIEMDNVPTDIIWSKA